MPASQQIPQDAASSPNGTSSLHDLFAMTDEQILEIEPETQDVEVSSADRTPSGKGPSGVAPASPESRRASLPAGSAASAQSERSRLEAGAAQADQGQADATQPVRPSGQAESAAPQEPPAWLAAQMKDPWTAEEAKELWNGVQQARQEAAAYRAAIATPEDARALKELYPGGVNEARATAERARVLDDIDRAYFGASGKSTQEISSSREQLAQRMLRENPAAFREMVFAGLRALEQSGQGTGGNAVAQALRPEGVSSIAASTAPTPGSQATEDDARLAAYASFEKAANEDLERRVGGAIERTLAQALPNAPRASNVSREGAQHAAPLQARLSQAIRQDVETALKGDRQLGEQVAQILSGRRLDNETRAQVVRLISERAQQLLPVAAKRVLNDWTQTTLATHRGNTVRTEAANARREVAPASLPASSSTSSGRSRGEDHALAPNNAAARSDPRRVDYRKLSDEQILYL